MTRAVPELHIVSGNTGYIDVGMLVGVYITDGTRCILLDSGPASEREAIEACLAAAGLRPDGVIATHSHFDHFGNARCFQEKYGLPVALPFGEAELCRTLPAIKSHLFVYSAGEIMSDPMLRGMPCSVDRVIMPSEDELYLRGVRFRVVRTPGHSPEHVSYITPDRVCFVGDALMCGRSLSGAKLPYAYNIRQFLESVEAFRPLRCDYAILPHKGVAEAPFDGLLDENSRVMRRRLEVMTDIVRRQMSIEEILSAARDTLHIRVDTTSKAEALERFVRPYLECLMDDGVLRQSLRGTGTLCFEPVT